MNYSSQTFKLAAQATLQACDEMHYVKDLSASDTYAQAIAKSIGSVSMTSGDYTFDEDETNDSDGVGAKITFAAKTLSRTDVCDTNDDITSLFLNTSSEAYHFGNNVTGLEVTASNTGISSPQFSTTIRNPA